MSEIPIVHTEEELDALFTRSSTHPVLLFKHSLTCPISARAHQRFSRFAASDPGGGPNVECAIIEVQRARPLCEAVATRTGVRHESPQALLLANGQAVWHANHGAIREDALGQALAEHAALTG